MQYPINIPTTIFDHFLDDPQKIRDWALTLNYAPEPTGRWPGKRSKPLHELNLTFFNMMCNKIISQFFDLNVHSLNWKVSCFFQLIDKTFHSGWVHDDANNAFTGILYLNPDSDLKGGTSIFREKKSLIKFEDNYLDVKKNSNLGKVSLDDTSKFRNEHNDQFEETIRISNVFNRLLCFDSHLHHAALDFFGDQESSRLTMIFFFEDLFSSKSPVNRVRNTLS